MIGNILQFCRPNWIMNGLTDLELMLVLARWCFLAPFVSSTDGKRAHGGEVAS